MSKIEDYEILELAGYICDFDESDIEEGLINKYGIDFNSFSELIEKIYDIMILSITPMNSTPVLGFADKENNSLLVKKEINSQFIKCAMDFLCDCDYDNIGKGVAKDIKEPDGSYKYSLQLRRIDTDDKENVTNKMSFEYLDHNMEAPSKCIVCNNWFDLDDGKRSKKWYVEDSLIICDDCHEIEKKEIEIDDEIEDLKNIISDNEYDIANIPSILEELQEKLANEKDEGEKENLKEEINDFQQKLENSKEEIINNREKLADLLYKIKF